MSRFVLPACISLSILALTTTARGLDAPGMYDARTVGMGGAGAASMEGATSVIVNPATLDGIGAFDATVDLSVMRYQSTHRFADGTPDVKSGPAIDAPFFAGAAYRVAKPIVVGIGIASTGNMDVGPVELPLVGSTTAEASVSSMTTELSIPVSYRITDGLAVAIGWRAVHATMSSEVTWRDVATGASGRNQTKGAGTSAKGLSAGVYYDRPGLRVGLSYRSKVVTRLTDESNPTGLDLVGESITPHSFRAGIAVPMVETRLLVSADVQYLMNKEAFGALEPEWKDVFEANLGMEYGMTDALALRLGCSFQTSPTPDSAASLAAPPGSIVAAHAGAGYEIGNVHLDLGAFYGFSGKTIENGTSPSGNGRYRRSVLLVAMSGSYRF